ncbi:hypothetical protein OBBRIDRAFT_886858, partial [Obba rivulosa]
MSATPALPYNILHEICEELERGNGGSKSLARVALVNQAFSEAALDVLWRRPRNGMVLLAKLLSVSYEERKYSKYVIGYESDGSDGSDGSVNSNDAFRKIARTYRVLTLKNPINTEQWARFQIYACRIRCVSYGENIDTIDPSVLYAIG